MTHYALGFLGRALVALTLIAFIVWQGKEALREYRQRKNKTPLKKE